MSAPKKAGTVIESIKVYHIYGTDDAKRTVKPQEFFMKASAHSKESQTRIGQQRQFDKGRK